MTKNVFPISQDAQPERAERDESKEVIKVCRIDRPGIIRYYKTLISKYGVPFDVEIGEREAFAITRGIVINHPDSFLSVTEEGWVMTVPIGF